MEIVGLCTRRTCTRLITTQSNHYNYIICENSWCDSYLIYIILQSSLLVYDAEPERDCSDDVIWR